MFVDTIKIGKNNQLLMLQEGARERDGTF